MVAMLSWEQALAWRMRRQYLSEPASAGEVVQVVSRLGGLHAQVMSAARLTLWARISHLRVDDLSAALWHRRSLVKFWAMRGTLCILDARDWPAWVAALTMYEQGYAHYGMRDPELGSLTEKVGELLNGRLMTRNDIVDALAADGRVSAEHLSLLRGSWGTALKPASFRGKLCFAPDEGRLVRFTHPHSWLRQDEVSAIRPDKAMATIVHRYLSVYAPASTADFAAWWGVSGIHAKSMLLAAKDKIDEVRIDGNNYWVLSDSVDQLAAMAPLPFEDVARLLPAFDPWVTAGNRRSRPGVGNPTLDERYRSCVYRRQGWVSPVVTLGGKIRGTWSCKLEGRCLWVEIRPFTPLRESFRSALEVQVGSLQQFLACESSRISVAEH